MTLANSKLQNYDLTSFLSILSSLFKFLMKIEVLAPAQTNRQGNKLVIFLVFFYYVAIMLLFRKLKASQQFTCKLMHSA